MSFPLIIFWAIGWLKINCVMQYINSWNQSRNTELILIQERDMLKLAV